MNSITVRSHQTVFQSINN